MLKTRDSLTAFKGRREHYAHPKYWLFNVQRQEKPFYLQTSHGSQLICLILKYTSAFYQAL